MDETLHATSLMQGGGCTSITLLHCTSVYTTLYTHAGLAAIETYARQPAAMQAGQITQWGPLLSIGRHLAAVPG